MVRWMKRKRAQRLGALLLGCASLGIPGCSFLLDADREQCAVDADCRERGAAFADSICVQSVCQAEPTWSCLNEPASTPGTGGPFAVALQLVGLVDQQPLAGVTARLCRKLDVDCMEPSEPVVSDENGVAELVVAGGFDGYVTLESDDIAPSLYFFNPPIDRDQHTGPVPLANAAVVRALTSQSGTPALEDRGIVVLTAQNCQSLPAAGVSYAVENTDPDPATKAFYSVAGLPTTSGAATDGSGYGGLLNVRPGTIAVTGRLQESGREMAKVSLLVRPNALTYAQLVPRGK